MADLQMCSPVSRLSTGVRYTALSPPCGPPSAAPMFTNCSIKCTYIHTLLHQVRTFSHLSPSSAHMFTPRSIECAYFTPHYTKSAHFHTLLHQVSPFSHHSPSSAHIIASHSIKCRLSHLTPSNADLLHRM